MRLRPSRLFVVVLLLSLSSWSGGVVFAGIDRNGLTAAAAVTLVSFAAMSVALGARILAAKSQRRERGRG